MSLDHTIPTVPSLGPNGSPCGPLGGSLADVVAAALHFSLPRPSLPQPSLSGKDGLDGQESRNVSSPADSDASSRPF